MDKRHQVSPGTRKQNFLARAYGFRVPSKFKCDECGHAFNVAQRFTDVELLEDRLAPIKSAWLDVKLKVKRPFDEKTPRQVDEDVCLFFFFDCPACMKRFFTCVYDYKLERRLDKVKFWSTLVSFEYGLIDKSPGSLRRDRASMQKRVDSLERMTEGSYVKDPETGLYSKVAYYHG